MARGLLTTKEAWSRDIEACTPVFGQCLGTLLKQLVGEALFSRLYRPSLALQLTSTVVTLTFFHLYTPFNSTWCSYQCHLFYCYLHHQHSHNSPPITPASSAGAADQDSNKLTLTSTDYGEVQCRTSMTTFWAGDASTTTSTVTKTKRPSHSHTKVTPPAVTLYKDVATEYVATETKLITKTSTDTVVTDVVSNSGSSSTYLNDELN